MRGRFLIAWSPCRASSAWAGSLHLLMDDAGSPFQSFLKLSDWLWLSAQKTRGLTPEALVDHLFDYLTTARSIVPQRTRETLLADYLQSGARAKPKVLQALLTRRAMAAGGANPPAIFGLLPQRGAAAMTRNRPDSNVTCASFRSAASSRPTYAACVRSHPPLATIMFRSDRATAWS